MLRIEIHHYVHLDRQDGEQLRALATEVATLGRKVDKMTVHTDALTAEVAQLTTVAQSAIAALNGIPQLVSDAVAKALADNNVADQAAQASIDQATVDATAAVDGLKSALTQNTPTS